MTWLFRYPWFVNCGCLGKSMEPQVTQDIPISMVIFGYRFIPFWILSARRLSQNMLDWILRMNRSWRFQSKVWVWKEQPSFETTGCFSFLHFFQRQNLWEDLERTLSSALEGKTDELATCQVDSGRVDCGFFVVNPHEIMIDMWFVSEPWEILLFPAQLQVSMHVNPCGGLLKLCIPKTKSS
jgi:hypothetical protein